jgi:thioredoxin reductase (NADPH)
MIVRDVVVVGAGPAGLATAIAARRAGLDYTVLEKAALVNTLFRSPVHMVCCATPDLLEIGGLPFVTPHERPTRLEALRYYRRVADTYELDLQLDEEVTRVFEDVDGDAQRVLSLDTRSSRGVRRVQHARFVVLATGAVEQPARLGVPGEDLPHVSHRYTEAHGYYRKRVVIVGGGHPAADAALDLSRSGARVTLVHRAPHLDASVAYWIRPALERRIEDHAIVERSGSSVVEIRPTAILVEDRGGQDEIAADAVLVLMGHHPAVAFFERAGLQYEADSVMPRHDPETLETTVPGLFVAGMVVFGRDADGASLERGRLHGEHIVRTIAERLRVQSA